MFSVAAYKTIDQSISLICLVFQYFWVVLMAQLSLGCHSIWIGLSLRSGQKSRVFFFLQHPTSLKLEVMNNVLTQFCMNYSFSDCKVFTEHFPRSVLEHPGGFGQTWVTLFRQWFSDFLFVFFSWTSFLFSVFLVVFFFFCVSVLHLEWSWHDVYS